MSPIALALLIVAAALHTGWNLLVKRAVNKQLFTWWSMAVGAICFAPLLALSPALPARIWPYIAVSALVEAIYYIALTRAYNLGDFSLVYPMARGAAPAFLALWAALFLGEHPQLGGMLGLALLLVGLTVVGLAAWRARRGAAAPGGGGMLAALAVACCISIYSAIDGAAMRSVNGISVPYTVAVIGLSAVFVTPVVLLSYGPGLIVTEWRTNWTRIILVGALSLIAYGLVLQAYAIGRVSYAGAIREISVVFAALVGWRWLGEGFGAVRTLGALMIFAGILVIALVG